MALPFLDHQIESEGGRVCILSRPFQELGFPMRSFLELRFSMKGIFALVPDNTWQCVKILLVAPDGECSWHLVGGHWGTGQPLSRRNWPHVSVVPRLGNRELAHCCRKGYLPECGPLGRAKSVHWPEVQVSELCKGTGNVGHIPGSLPHVEQIRSP